MTNYRRRTRARGIVLSDHHPEMAADGFLSNRLFDAVATGARVVSDSAAGLEDVFGDAVVVFTDEDDLVDILHTPVDDTFPSRDRRVEGSHGHREENTPSMHGQVFSSTLFGN